MSNKYFWASGILVVAVAVYGIFSSSKGSQHLCANSGNCGELPSLRVQNDQPGKFLGQAVAPPKIDLNSDQGQTMVLGDKSDSDNKVIYVNLEKQTLTAYQGDELILETLISSGKWGRTPPGEYQIWVKMRATLMSGGSGNDAYYLPNVPYTMFFYGDGMSKAAGYALHGAYWHNNFGHPMSHGCVNMREVDAKIIYDWASPATDGNITYANAQNSGTKIIIR